MMAQTKQATVQALGTVGGAVATIEATELNNPHRTVSAFLLPIAPYTFKLAQRSGHPRTPPIVHRQGDEGRCGAFPMRSSHTRWLLGPDFHELLVPGIAGAS